VYASDLATTLRSAPGWMLATIAVVIVIALVAAGPLAGLAIKRRREAEISTLLERPGLQRQHGKWVETGEIDLTSLRAEELRREREEFRTSWERANGAAPDSDPVIVIRDDGKIPAFGGSEIITDMEDIKPIERPAWADTPTAGWTAQTYAAEVFDAVVVEEETAPEFYADPLGAWSIPLEAEEAEGWPTAKSVMEEMIDRKWLTGIGADIDTEWAAWNLEGAMA
jgi:hypothetical protein